MKQLITLSVYLLLVSMANSSNGQEVIEQHIEFGQPELAQILQGMPAKISGKVTDRIGKSIMERTQAKLSLQIDFISRVCKLSEKQKKRLSFVAKGTVQKITAPLLKMLPAAEKEENPKKKNNERGVVVGQEIEVGEDGGLIANGAAIQLGLVNGAMGGEIELLVLELLENSQKNNPADNPFWNKQLEKVLTKDQIALLKKERAKRAKQSRKATVNYVVSQLSTMLLLSDSQQQKLAVLIDRKWGRQIDRSNRSNLMYGVEIYSTIIASGDKELMKLLTKSQKAMIQRKMKQFGGQMFLGEGWMGAQPPENEAIEIEENGTTENNK